MLLQIKQPLSVENPRNYSSEIIEELEELLLSGGPSVPDPRRQSFYDMTSHRRTFFIYISPKTGRVTLLGAWLHAVPAFELADCAAACE